MERYLGGEEIDQSVLIDDLEKAVARGSFFPVIPVCSATGVGTLELLEIATSGFPSPLEHPLPEVFTPQGAPRNSLTCDPGRPAARRGGEDDVGPLRRQGQPGPGVLRDHQARRDGARVGPFFVLLRYGATAMPTTTRTSASARCRSRSGKQQRPAPSVVAGDICAIGRLSRAETGDTLSDKSDPLVLKPWTMPEPLLPIAVQPRAKTDEDKLSVGLAAVGGRRPDAADRAEPRDASDRAVVHGRGALGRRPRRAGQPLRRHRGHRGAPRSAAGNLRRQSQGPRPAREAVRRARAVRRLRHRGGAAAGGRRVRVRRQGGRRRGAAEFHPERGEGDPRADGEGGRRRLSGGRHPGHPVRRQGAQRRLVGLRVPDGGRVGAARGGVGDQGEPARAGGRGVGDGARRPRRRGDERPVHPPRPCPRHRQGR